MCSTKAAYSDGCPSLLGCGTEFPSATRAFSGKAASKGVSNKPGQIVFTRIWYFAKSRAIGRVIPTMPALDPPYSEFESWF